MSCHDIVLKLRVVVGIGSVSK